MRRSSCGMPGRCCVHSDPDQRPPTPIHHQLSDSFLNHFYHTQPLGCAPSVPSLLPGRPQHHTSVFYTTCYPKRAGKRPHSRTAGGAPARQGAAERRPCPSGARAQGPERQRRPPGRSAATSRLDGENVS